VICLFAVTYLVVALLNGHLQEWLTALGVQLNGRPYVERCAPFETGGFLDRNEANFNIVLQACGTREVSDRGRLGKASRRCRNHRCRKQAVLARLRFLFAFFGEFERNRDITPTEKPCRAVKKTLQL
jgi:hypothetical protein